MSVPRPRGIGYFLKIYLILLVLSGLSYIGEESPGGIYALIIMGLIFLYLSYGVFFGYSGNINFFTGFCCFIGISCLLMLLVNFDFNKSAARWFVWLLFTSSLAIYLQRIRGHAFFKYTPSQ